MAVTRRAFLKLTLVAGSAAAFVRLLPGRAVAAVKACIPVAGTQIPLAIPTEIGDDCAPPPALTATYTPSATRTPSATATETITVTPSATATATPTATVAPPLWRLWLPVILKRSKP